MILVKNRRGTTTLMGTKEEKTIIELIKGYYDSYYLLWWKLQKAFYLSNLKHPFFRAVDEDLKVKKLPMSINN